MIFSLDPLYRQLPLPVRVVSREELDAMSTASPALVFWADQHTKVDRRRYSSEVQAARFMGRRHSQETKAKIREANVAFWEDYRVWLAEQGEGDWKRECPSCGKSLSYARYTLLERAARRNTKCRNCRGGWKLSEDSCRRISEANRRKVYQKCAPGCICRKHSAETREKRRLAALGKKHNVTEAGKARQDLARRRRLKGQLFLDIF